MKREDVNLCARILRGGVILLGVMLLAGTLLWALAGSGHDPNHDINREQAREAASRVHTPPPPDEKRVPGAGG